MTTRYKFLRLVNGNIVSEADHNLCWRIGEWQEWPHLPGLCYQGFHCSPRIYDAFRYVKGEIVAQVEVAGACDRGADKKAWQRMCVVKAWRWRVEDSVAMAIFAAGLVIDFYERQYPDDNRPRKAIEAAESWMKNPAAVHAAADAARAAAVGAAADAAAAAADAAADADAAYAAARAADADAYAAADAYADADDGTIERINAWMEAHLSDLEVYEEAE